MAGSIQHRPDRRSPWRARYRAPDGRQRSRSFRRKIDAERWLRDQLAAIDRGAWVDPHAGQTTVEEWAELWMARRVRLAATTEASYRSILRSRILPTFGTTQLGKVTRGAVADWVRSMVEEGLSASRVRNSFNVLASMLDAAVSEGLIGRNPARGVELPAQPIREHRFLSAVEVARLADAAGDARSLIYVLAYGGLRWGEAVALRVGRVDLPRRRLDIVENASEVGGRLVFGEPKTHQRRTVHLPPFVAEELAAHLEGRPGDPDALVWTSPKGGPLNYGGFRRRVWAPAVAAVGLEGLTPHHLRHSCASLMWAAGADVKAISQQLGHRTPAVTMSVYTHLFEGAYDPVMDRLDAQHRQLWPTRGPEVVGLEKRKQVTPR